MGTYQSKYTGAEIDRGLNPVGTIISFMGTIAPEGFLTCDGAVLNITDYPKLASHFETQFGSKNHFGGDGETTFAVPDLRNAAYVPIPITLATGIAPIAILSISSNFTGSRFPGSIFIAAATNIIISIVTITTANISAILPRLFKCPVAIYAPAAIRVITNNPGCPFG